MNKGTYRMGEIFLLNSICQRFTDIGGIFMLKVYKQDIFMSQVYKYIGGVKVMLEIDNYRGLIFMLRLYKGKGGVRAIV